MLVYYAHKHSEQFSGNNFQVKVNHQKSGEFSVTPGPQHQNVYVNLADY